jgi:hypothetical protein
MESSLCWGHRSDGAYPHRRM